MSKKLIFILFSVLMFACGNSKKEKMEEMIAGKEYVYFILIETDSIYLFSYFPMEHLEQLNTMIYYIQILGNC